MTTVTTTAPLVPSSEPLIVRVQGDLPLVDLLQALARGGLRLRCDATAGRLVIERAPVPPA